jgi:putative resolvase
MGDPAKQLDHSLVRNRRFIVSQLDPQPHFVTGATIRKTYDVSPSTLRDWADQGKVKAIRAQSSSGKRRYDIHDVLRLLGYDEEEKTRRRICYARVSSQHQQADLDRQCADLRRAYPNHELIRDIGSGINWRRPGLLAILDAVCAGTVAEIVVAHRDRLARIGVELLEWLFKRYDTRFVVHEHSEERPSETDELRDDLLAIVTFFVARNNGRRAAANRKRRATAREEAEGDEEGERRRQAKRRKVQEDSHLPERTAAEITQAVVWDSQVDIQPVPGRSQEGSFE